ncbi:MAG TPA: hypothetical protein VI461_01425 [Chitinophagaceae bacterium]|nr:hypothetical protein [Chitinophagaceae bacterium]
MKKIITLLLLPVFFIACNNESKDTGSNSSSDSGKVKKPEEKMDKSVPEGGRYGIKSAKVVTVTALPRNMGNTTVTMYFDNYGTQSFTETVSNITMKGMPKTSQPKQYNITEGEYIYSWTEGSKSGTKMKFAINNDLKNMDFEKLGMEMSERLKIKKTGNETFLGKSCDVYEMDNAQLGKGKILIWKNITMLSDMTTMSMNVKSEVTELEENPSIESSKFKVASDIDFKELQIPVKL